MDLATRVNRATYTLGFLAALAAPGSLFAEEKQVRTDYVYSSNRYDGWGDRILFGGYSYASSLTTGLPTEAKEAKAIYSRSTSGNEPAQVVFRVRDGYIVDFAPSSSGRLAVLAVHVEGNSEEPSAVRANKVALHVSDATGSPIVNRLEPVRDFKWDSSGTLLAYCTGDADGSIDDFRMNGTWVLDTRSGKSTKVLETGRHVAWADFDGNLYIRDVPPSVAGQPRTWRYDPRTGSVVEVPYKGIHFSPSGLYYFEKKSPNYGRFDLFESSSGRSLLASSTLLKGLVPEPVGWMPDGDVLILQSWYYGEPGTSQPVAHTMLYDARSGQVVDLGEIAVLGFDRSRRVVKWERGAIMRTDVDELTHGGLPPQRTPK